MKISCGWRWTCAAALIVGWAGFPIETLAAAAKPKTVEYLVTAANTQSQTNATFRLMEKGKERHITGIEFTAPVVCNNDESLVVSVTAGDMPDWKTVSKNGKAAGKYSFVEEYTHRGNAVVTVWFVLDGNRLALHIRRTQTGVTCEGELSGLRVTGRTKLSTKVYAPLIIHDDVDHYLNVQAGVPTGYLVAGSALCPDFEINGNPVSVAIICSTAGDVSMQIGGDGSTLQVTAETKSEFEGNPVSSKCKTVGVYQSSRDRWLLTTTFSYSDPVNGLNCSSSFDEALVRW